MLIDYLWVNTLTSKWRTKIMGTKTVRGRLFLRFFEGVSMPESLHTVENKGRQLCLQLYAEINKLAELPDMKNADGKARWVRFSIGKSYFDDKTKGTRARVRPPFYSKGENERGMVRGWKEISPKAQDALCVEVLRLVRSIKDLSWEDGAIDVRREFEIVMSEAKNAKATLVEVDSQFKGVKASKKAEEKDEEPRAFQMDEFTL